MFATTKIIAAFSSIALLASAGAASAEDFASNGRTTQVRFGDLDLSNQAHQQELRTRIARAANRVCSSMDLTVMRTCKERAIAHVEAPIAAAIARADSKDRYADAGKDARVVVGN